MGKCRHLRSRNHTFAKKMTAAKPTASRIELLWKGQSSLSRVHKYMAGMTGSGQIDTEVNQRDLVSTDSSTQRASDKPDRPISPKEPFPSGEIGAATCLR